jgi:hypothetical protein
VRFEVLGNLSGSVWATETLRVLNLGPRGALVEAALPLPDNTELSMRLVLESHVSDVKARIRRVTETGGDSTPLTYLIGLEFLKLSAEAEESIGRLIAGRSES